MTRPFIKRGVRIVLIVGVTVFLAFIMLFNKDFIGTTFATGGLNLKIDSYSIYNGVVQPAQTWALKNLVPGVDKFFDLDDVKPGDEGKTIISFHTNENAWACMDFSNLVDTDNGNNEPETQEDSDGALGGELSSGIEFFSWVDDGDNTYEPGEKALFGTSTPQAGFNVLKQYILADSSTGSFFSANTTKYVGIQWCAGNLEVNTTTGVITCDGSVLGNGAQTDSFSVDLALRAVTADDSPTFRCDGTSTIPGLELFLEKKFSGPEEGFTPEQFSFHVVGNGIDVVVPHGGSITLPAGTYSITEVVPSGFNIPDWRIQWSGDTCTGQNIAGGLGSITVKEKDITKKVTSYCRADNQYRPVKGNNGHGNEEDGNDDSNPGNSNDENDNTDDDGVPQGQQSAIQTNSTSQTVTTQTTSPFGRAVRSVRDALRR